MVKRQLIFSYSCKDLNELNKINWTKNHAVTIRRRISQSLWKQKSITSRNAYLCVLPVLEASPYPPRLESHSAKVTELVLLEKQTWMLYTFLHHYRNCQQQRDLGYTLLYLSNQNHTYVLRYATEFPRYFLVYSHSYRWCRCKCCTYILIITVIEN